MEYPKILTPNFLENFEFNGQIVQIPKVIVEFTAWNGIPIENTFGNKPLINFNGKPMFAELAIMNIFIENSWNAKWIETYAKPKMNPIYLSEWIDKPFKNQKNDSIDNKLIQIVLNAIAKNNGDNFGGCWDVVAWKNDKIIFAESKRSKKDSIKTTQNKWLKSAFEIGLTEENFLIVEWKT